MGEQRVFKPSSAADLGDLVADTARKGAALQIRGGGSKAAIGAPAEVPILDMSAFAGVVDYDPTELVLTIGAATLLSEVQALVAAEGQMLAFDPFDHGPLLGRPEGRATLGGVIAAGVSGSRRVARGAARDHLLGFKAVSGRGEAFVAGGKVVKNVTGFDLSKLVVGSWGRLVALTELTLKVVPRGRAETTLVFDNLGGEAARAVMTRAMRAPAEVCATAHVPAPLNNGSAVTALRLEGFAPSVAARAKWLMELLSQYGAAHAISREESEVFWRSVRDVSPLANAPVLWRIGVPPHQGMAVGVKLDEAGARWLADWAGGLVWAAFEGDPATVRGLAAAAGGHAFLLRAPAAMRAAVPAFHPESPGIQAISERVRRAFDPDRVFESKRFADGTHADRI